MPRGGARPGAGRKKKATKELQIANRDIVLAAVDAEALRSMVTSMVTSAQEGDTKAFAVIAPYLLGAPTQEIELSGSVAAEVKLSDEARAERIGRLLERIRTRADRPAAQSEPDLGAADGPAD